MHAAKSVLAKPMLLLATALLSQELPLRQKPRQAPPPAAQHLSRWEVRVQDEMTSPTENIPDDVPSPTAPSKPYPCDQCRRRKVKCNTNSPCDRCTQSGLRCTREIIRKRRGPKKGSGSVIAKLRNEVDRVISPSIPGQQPGDFSTAIPLQRPRTARSNTGDSVHSSTGSGNFGAGLAPTSDPSSFYPNPFPQSHAGSLNQHDVVPWAHPSDDDIPVDYPTTRRPTIDHGPLKYDTPSSDGFVSITDLAHKIFDHNDAMLGDMPNIESLSVPKATTHSSPIAAILASEEAIIISSTTSSANPALGLDIPRALYRSNSGPGQIEPRLSALASDIGVSAFLMSQCVKQYFRHLYPIMPIIHEATFCQRLNEPDELSIDEKCLLFALCAITVLHAAPHSDLSLDAKQQLGRQFLSNFHRLRHISEWIESASLMTIIASYFVSVSYFELKQPRSHHFYLREAIGMCLEQGLHLSSFYTDLNSMQAICHQRTFALLFVTERGCAILRNKPVLITNLPLIPGQGFDDETPSIVSGFQCLCQLFATLDRKFVEIWRDSALGDQDHSASFVDIAAIQNDLSNFTIRDGQLNDIQRADVLITQQWLRIIFWQSSTRQGLVTSSAQDASFSYDYPIMVAHALCGIMSTLPLEAILVHGLGIFEKIFEVAYTLMDALMIANIPWNDSNDLRYLFDCLSASPNSQTTYVRMLEMKMDDQMVKLEPRPNGDSNELLSTSPTGPFLS